MTEVCPDSAFRHAVRQAMLSPSSHNSQPWTVRRDGNEVSVALDAQRCPRALPAHSREMWISLGCFRWCLKIALRAVGCELVDCGVSGHGTDITVNGVLVPGRDEPTGLLALTNRHTQRGPYRDEPLTAFERDGMSRAAARVSQSARFAVSAERDACLRAAQVVRRYAVRDFTHQAAWAETWTFIKGRDRVHSADGFGMETLFGARSRAARFLLTAKLHPRTPGRWRRRHGEQLVRNLAAAVERSAAVVTIGSSAEPSAAQDIVVGESLMAAWLAATEHGLSWHPISVLAQHPDSADALRSALGLDATPIFFARVGRPVEPGPASGRRAVDQLLLGRRPGIDREGESLRNS